MCVCIVYMCTLSSMAWRVTVAAYGSIMSNGGMVHDDTPRDSSPHRATCLWLTYAYKVCNYFLIYKQEPDQCEVIGGMLERQNVFCGPGNSGVLLLTLSSLLWIKFFTWSGLGEFTQIQFGLTNYRIWLSMNRYWNIFLWSIKQIDILTIFLQIRVFFKIVYLVRHWTLNLCSAKTKLSI